MLGQDAKRHRQQSTIIDFDPFSVLLLISDTIW